MWLKNRQRNSSDDAALEKSIATVSRLTRVRTLVANDGSDCRALIGVLLNQQKGDRSSNDSAVDLVLMCVGVPTIDGITAVAIVAKPDNPGATSLREAVR